MKTIFLAAVVVAFSVSLFGQSTSARYITRKVVPPANQPPAAPTPPAPSQSNPAGKSQAAATAKPVVPVVREKSKEEKEATLKKTIEFQQKRAEQGSASSQYDLAVRYMTGDGVTKDLEQARKWFEAAAKQGNSMAAKKLEELKALKP